MTDDELAVVAQLTEPQVVALTLFGEARGEPIEGRIAIADVIRNRVRLQRPRLGMTARQVCLKAWQFSCWLPQGGEPNYHTVIDAARQVLQNNTGPKVRECLWIAEGALAERYADTVKGSTHYYNPAAMKPVGRVPDWAKGLAPVAIVSGHQFFAGVK